MLRIVSVMFVFSTCGILSAWAQTDVPEGSPAPIQPPIQRVMRSSPPIGGSIRSSDASPSPAMPSAASPSRSTAPVPPPFSYELVPVIPTKEGENGHVRTVCRLANIPANSAATILTKLFKAEGESVTENVKNKVVIVPEPMGNCLFVSGPPAAVEEVRRLVTEIDRRPSIVSLEVQISEVSSEKEKKTPDADAPKSKIAEDESPKKPPDKTEEGPLMHMELSTLDNQTAYVQFGRQEAHITGSSSSSVGMTNSVTQMNVGTIVQMTPRVAAGGIVALQLSINDSRTGPIEEGTPITSISGRVIRQPSIDMLQNQTTLQLQDGQTQTISAISRNGKTCQIAVTAHILRPGATNSAE
jgi:hypothetical protein